MLTIAAGCALLVWAAVLVLPWQPHRTRERLEPSSAAADEDCRDVAVLIPARDEAAVIGRTIAALRRQGRNLRVTVVDDQSSDGTAAAAQRAAAGPGASLELEVLAGQPLPADWAGKLWALEQGLATVDRPFVLLLDADIELGPGVVPALLAEARRGDKALVSVMALLRAAAFWEKLLAPPFVLFFKLLYPFALANDPRRCTAAAAGGCMLVAAETLRRAGGFAAIRGALIDDCTLAALLKRSGSRTWLGLSRDVRSLRPYERLGDFWSMVSRSAFTQLRYSGLLLAATALLMLLLFVAPLAAIASGSLAASLAGGGALAAMCAVYWPTVRFYGLPAAWTLTLPAAAVLFLAMTVSSALGYWRGTRATWKNRAYDTAS